MIIGSLQFYDEDNSCFFIHSLPILLNHNFRTLQFSHYKKGICRDIWLGNLAWSCTLPGITTVWCTGKMCSCYFKLCFDILVLC